MTKTEFIEHLISLNDLQIYTIRSNDDFYIGSLQATSYEKKHGICNFYIGNLLIFTLNMREVFITKGDEII